MYISREGRGACPEHVDGPPAPISTETPGSNFMFIALHNFTDTQIPIMGMFRNLTYDKTLRNQILAPLGLVQKVLILGNRRHSGEVDEGGEA